MRYEIDGEVVTFYLDNPKRDNPNIRRASFAGTGLTPAQITPMLDATVDSRHGYSLSTQASATKVVVVFFAGFRATGVSWPTHSQEWAIFVLHFFQWYFTNSESSSRTDIRSTVWSSILVPWLDCLKDAEIIPLDVVIPRVQTKKLARLEGGGKQLLGQGQQRVTDPAISAQKLLVDVSFGMTDTDYLDALEERCRHLVGVIKEVCLLHWRGAMQDAETGRKLAAQVSDDMIDRALAEERYGEVLKSSRGQLTKYASPAHPQGIAWALAWVRHSLKRGNTRNCVSTPTMRRSPFFNTQVFHGIKYKYSVLEGLTILTTEQWENFSGPARLYRFAGLLSGLDAAAACAILTIEHPQFTSESLQNAMLLNVRGKPRLLVTDNTERAILVIDKPRAGKLKSAALSELAQEIVQDIIRTTAPVREVLKRAGDKRWRYLFLGALNDYGRSRVGILSVLNVRTALLHGAGTMISLPRLYPLLTQNKLMSGAFDFRRLRNTLGVLKWFETGSILEMSRTLGNTRKVALNNYLPAALLHAWNTRIIRRFQNTLIVLAAHDEPYLLEVADFSSLADLQHFIAQLILDYPPNTSPLADEVQRRLKGTSPSPSATPPSAPGFLNVRLSPKSLAYLYAFRDLALKTLSTEQQNKVDALSGLSPRQFIDMAKLLTHAAENTKLHPALRDSLDVTQLIETHGRALALKGEIDMQFSKLTLKRKWEAT
ncbi:hypothetical protein SAMN02745746_01503 [Pseudogulbenkiania subflava DSM 22618]|uniref:Uncharacterized protein n=2 Tax=Pseudogulbenkiania subflava TaxID=451637 RepID=A0A1Y6BJ31_9NEIS|nr:hypothetical protein SAMN02745746_01503 [Pseudogulbenkiania subflava DSM 22618]